MFRNTEGATKFSEQAKAILDQLPGMSPGVKSAALLTRGVIRVQERLQIEPYVQPTLSDLLIVAKYAQMIAWIELGERQDASALAWAKVALRLWDDAVDQSLIGAAILDILLDPQEG